MAYYIVYGVIVGIGAFFVYYFVLGGRMELAQELTKMIIAFGFFVVLFIINYFKGNQQIKKIKNEIGSDEEITHISSKMKLLDKTVSIVLGLIILFIALLGNSLDSIDIAQVLLAVIIHYGWHYYLFLSRAMVSYSTVSALTYLDKTKDYAVLLIISMVVLLMPILGRSFSSIDILQALVVFIVAYTWHRYLFIPK